MIDETMHLGVKASHTFILRCWRESAENSWSYRLEDPISQLHWTFRELVELTDFFKQYLMAETVFEQVFTSRQ
ncbi:MAG TPA: hypothetical protein ENJ56_00760 [Anaerolineae bacterium]|nr:hypothetical protein [Anaerolineae bacterium]